MSKMFVMDYIPHFVASTAGQNPFQLVSNDVETLKRVAQERSDAPLTWRPSMNNLGTKFNEKAGYDVMIQEPDTSGEKWNGSVDFKDKHDAGHFGRFRIRPVEFVS